MVWTEELIKDLYQARALDARPYSAIATALSAKHNVSLTDEACRKKFKAYDWSHTGPVDSKTEDKEEYIDKEIKAAESKKEQYDTRTDVLCDLLEKAVERLPKQPKPVWKPTKKPKEERTEDVCVMLSDLHVGHNHTLEDTGGLSEYNIDIFRKRMSNLTKAVERIVELHSAMYKLPTLRIFSLGDIVAGMNDVGAWSPLYINTSIIDQTLEGFNAISDFVHHFLGYFDNIEFYGISGNHGRCKPLSTKVLTKNGYKSYNEVKVGDLVGTVNRKTHKFEFNPIEKIHIYKNEEKIVKAKNRSFCLEATLDHDNLVVDSSGRLKKIKSKTLSSNPTCTNNLIPISFKSNNAEYDIEDKLLTLLGWIMTDGSYANNCKSTAIYQSKVINIPIIRQLLQDLNTPFNEYVRSRHTKDICGIEIKSCLNEYCFEILRCDIRDKVRELLPERESIQPWMYELSDRQVGVLLEAIVAGDGTIRKTRVSSNGYVRNGGNDAIWGNKQFLEQLMGLLISHNIPCRVNKHKRKVKRQLKDGTEQGDNFYLQLKRSKSYNLENKEFKEIEYNKDVWCVTVANGTIAVMNEDGNAYFTGNCAKNGLQKEHDNWDYVCHKFLETRFEQIPRVKFHTPKSWWYMDRIRGHNFLMVHGHDVRGGSMPIKGLANLEQKMAMITKSFPDYTLAGHFHNTAMLGTSSGKVLINGTFVGPDVYALKTVQVGGKAEQKVFGLGDKHGITWSYDVNLDIERD